MAILASRESADRPLLDSVSSEVIDETAQHNRRCARRGITLAIGRESADHPLLDSVSSELLSMKQRNTTAGVPEGYHGKALL
jgi:hypothetical protein